MRRFGKRPQLEAGLSRRLSRETGAIAQSTDPRKEAERRYTNARQTNWFAPVEETLKAWSGPGSRCMYCSGSESAEVEHFRPKSVFPELALTWDNMLWVCGVCNRAKGDRFPPDTEPGGPVINPGAECVWDFFFIDEFGYLTPLWRDDVNGLDQRASCTEVILKLNRQALQEARQSRLHDLRQKVEDILKMRRAGQITPQEIDERIETWLRQPFQPDVADYFLRGPGSKEKPYRDLLALIEDPCRRDCADE